MQEQQPTSIQLQVVNSPGQPSAGNVAGGIPLGFVTLPSSPQSGAPESAGDPGGSSIDLVGIFRNIVSKWWVILICLVLALGIAWYYLQKKTPLFVSEGAVKVEETPVKVLPIPQFHSENYDKLEYLNTIEQSITANTRLLNVAKKLDLINSAQFLGARKEGRSLNNTEILRVMRSKVQAMLRRGTRVIDVYVSDPDPELAKRIADAVIAEAVNSAGQESVDAAMKLRSALEGQLEHGRKKLELSQKSMDDYQGKYPKLPLDSGSQALSEKSRALLNELTKLEAERASFQASVDMIESVDRSSLESLMQLDMVANSPEVVQLLTKINLQTAAFASLQERYLYKHPKYKKARVELDQMRQAGLKTAQTVLDATQRKFERSMEKERAIKASLEKQNAEQIELIRILGPYNLLKQTRDDDRELLEQIQKRIKESDVTRDLVSSKLSIFSPPLGCRDIGAAVAQIQ